MHDKRELDLRLSKAGIFPSKKLGQNFLLNPIICKRIIDCVFQSKPATIVEIGPGAGALTDDLLKGPWKTLLIEFDAGLARYWKNEKAAEVIHTDAIKMKWEDLDLQKPAVLVSNLPYSIAATLVVDLSFRPHPFNEMILMFQKEVAERIEVQKGPDYGMLSVMAQTSWSINRVIDAGPQDFFPVPNVGSRVLRFVPKSVDFSKEKFLAFVKLAFSHRRKKLLSNLSAHHQPEKIERTFASLRLGPNTRAQELTPHQFSILFLELSK